MAGWTGTNIYSWQSVSDYANHSGDWGPALYVNQSLSQTITGLQPNSVYNARVWVYVDSTGGGTGALEVSNYGGSTVSSTTSALRNWTQVTRTFITWPNATSATIRLTVPSAPTLTVWFDDVEVLGG